MNQIIRHSDGSKPKQFSTRPFTEDEKQRIADLKLVKGEK